MSETNVLKIQRFSHPKIKALQTLRTGGVGTHPYASFNLAKHCGDDLNTVEANRARLLTLLPSAPVWLNQTHSTDVVLAEEVEGIVSADASFTHQSNVVCVVMTADCLPVFFAKKDGSAVAVAHAGWRGLCEGILENTVAKLATQADEIEVYLGPCISAYAFEVGAEVRDAFMQHDQEASSAFEDIGAGKFLADLHKLATLRLNKLGITQIEASDDCTVIDKDKYFSYRRDSQTGRMASLIWIES